MVLKELISTVSTFQKVWWSLERTYFQQFLLWEGVVVLKEVILKFLLWEGVVVLKELIFNSFYSGTGVVVS